MTALRGLWWIRRKDISRKDAKSKDKGAKKTGGLGVFYVGVDLGQKRDFTAVAVVERVEAYSAYRAPVLGAVHVRYLERVPLGTPYPAVAERVRKIVQCGAIGGDAVLIVDATGVGRPVVDLLNAAKLRCEVVAVTITGGEKAARSGDGWSVPKKDLMAGVQVLLEKEQLKIAKGLKAAGALVRELAEMRADGREGREHDDLAIALALGCWRATQGTVGLRGGRLL